MDWQNKHRGVTLSCPFCYYLEAESSLMRSRRVPGHVFPANVTQRLCNSAACWCFALWVYPFLTRGLGQPVFWKGPVQSYLSCVLSWYTPPPFVATSYYCKAAYWLTYYLPIRDVVFTPSSKTTTTTQRALYVMLYPAFNPAADYPKLIPEREHEAFSQRLWLCVNENTRQPETCFHD